MSPFLKEGEEGCWVGKLRLGQKPTPVATAHATRGLAHKGAGAQGGRAGEQLCGDTRGFLGDSRRRTHRGSRGSGVGCVLERATCVVELQRLLRNREGVHVVCMELSIACGVDATLL